MDKAMEQTYFVSVITPARNEARYIGTLLNDFLHQDYPSHLRELIVVDAHASIPPDYLRIGVQLLQEHAPEGVGCVGGITQTVGSGFWGQAFSAVLNSP